MLNLIHFIAFAICFNCMQAGQCPAGNACSDDNTCCKLTSGEYGCCPHPTAACCFDGEHCCPQNYTCDLTRGKCIHKLSLLASLIPNKIKMETKIPAVNTTAFENGKQCPAGEPECSQGCCPYVSGICCDNGTHCCPPATMCVLSTFCFPVNK